MELEGRTVPPMKNKPEIWYDAIPYWSAYNQLTSSRQLGMAEGFIPYSEITNFLTENRIDSFEERQLYRRIIMTLDSVYISLQNAKSEKKSKANKNKKR